jgi:hypothetical protein
MIKRIVATTIASLALSAGVAVSAYAAPLPDNCTKVQGEVACTEGPGQNQAGVGTTTETQGNTTNVSPEPQDLDTTQNPPKAQGAPITG